MIKSIKIPIQKLSIETNKETIITEAKLHLITETIKPNEYNFSESDFVARSFVRGSRMFPRSDYTTTEASIISLSKEDEITRKLIEAEKNSFSCNIVLNDSLSFDCGLYFIYKMKWFPNEEMSLHYTLNVNVYDMTDKTQKTLRRLIKEN